MIWFFVSIHLMLLFIRLCQSCWRIRCGFNTSHVTLYRNCFPVNLTLPGVSIHLMLLFINGNKWRLKSQMCFNTSHVTLYLIRLIILKGRWLRFQYISCYSLSVYSNHSTGFVVTFQYISCYSLSCSPPEGPRTGLVSIHLMLLFILLHRVRRRRVREFQYISCYSLSVACQDVSGCGLWFQYISCYSLSMPTGGSCFLMKTFQYISCYSLSTL